MTISRCSQSTSQSLLMRQMAYLNGSSLERDRACAILAFLFCSIFSLSYLLCSDWLIVYQYIIALCVLIFPSRFIHTKSLRDSLIDFPNFQYAAVTGGISMENYKYLLCWTDWHLRMCEKQVKIPQTPELIQCVIRNEFVDDKFIILIVSYLVGLWNLRNNTPSTNSSLFCSIRLIFAVEFDEFIVRIDWFVSFHSNVGLCCCRRDKNSTCK